MVFHIYIKYIMYALKNNILYILIYTLYFLIREWQFLLKPIILWTYFTQNVNLFVFHTQTPFMSHTYLWNSKKDFIITSLDAEKTFGLFKIILMDSFVS